MSTTIPIDDISIRIDDTELLSITLHGVTVEAERDWVDGSLFLRDLRIEGRPYPTPGGKPSDFDRELAKRVFDAVHRDWSLMAWIEEQVPQLPINDGIEPGQLLASEMR